jgi:probable phosphoglycerate mutase
VEGRFQGRADPPLSALGQRQAAAAAARIAKPDRPPRLPIPGGPPLVVAHSPLGRAAATARAVAAALAVPPAMRPEPGLAEIGQGDWEGLHGAEIAARWPDVLAGWRRDPVHTWAPGGESLAEVDERVRRFLRPMLGELARGREPGSTNRSQVLGYRDPGGEAPWALLVGHDGVFKITLLALLDLLLARFWAFPFALAGITVVEIRSGRARLRAHNLVEHLDAIDGDAASRSARPNGAL